MRTASTNAGARAPASWRAAALAAALTLLSTAGCSTTDTGAVDAGDGPSQVELARTALAANNLAGAEPILNEALRPRATKRKKSEDELLLQALENAELLMLRAELRIRQDRYPEAEADALTAMALVPATPDTEPAAPAAAQPGKKADEETELARRIALLRRRPMLSQRGIHLRMAQLYEDVGKDGFAEHHINAARELCLSDQALVERRECKRERDAMIRIRIASGRYGEAEPLVLAEIADVQQRYGAEDIRLSFALCDAARFYARQGSYALSGPLYTRSFSLWKTSHLEALGEHERAIAAGQPSPFDPEFLRPRAGHIPFSAPCGLSDQPGLLYKLGLANVAADAARYEQQLWGNDTKAATMVVAYADDLIKKNGDPLDIASARHAVAFVAMKKGDTARAEQELRLVTQAYAAAWPNLPLSERRYRADDYLRALHSLIEILRSSQRFPEAVELDQRAVDVAAGVADPYDALRLDTLLSQAITYREMRDPERAEAASGDYLDAVRKARGDASADYAWALRTISFAYLLREELDASQRMEMQAKAIWAKQGIVAPSF